MKKIVCLAVFLFSAAAFAAEPVGQVADMAGKVFITTAGKKPLPAAFKQPLYLRDTIETKQDGAVKILFVDDTLLTLKENSKALITEFLFHPKAKKRKAVLNILFGRARTVVGRFFGADQPVEIKTPTAVAGIRGTDVGAVVKAKSTTFYCFNGSFDAFNVKTPGEVVRVAEGKFTEILAGEAPTPPADIPADIQDNQNQIFDIPLSQAASAVAPSGGVVPAGAETPPASGNGDSLPERGAEVRDNENFVEGSTPSTTTSSSGGGEVITGGSTEVTNPSTITITLPTP